MTSQPIDGLLSKSRENWSQSAHDLADRLAAYLNKEMSDQELLGRQLADARQTANLTQPELAERTGINQADISRIERGLGNPTRDTLLKLANALGMRLVLQSLEARQKPEK